jgi:hypothetical protein
MKNIKNHLSYSINDYTTVKGSHLKFVSESVNKYLWHTIRVSIHSSVRNMVKVPIASIIIHKI